MENTPISALAIESWATDPNNKEAARALGQRLITYANDAGKLAAQPSLGAFQDRAILWAIRNETSARMLMMKLLPKLM